MDMLLGANIEVHIKNHGQSFHKATDDIGNEF